MSEINLPPFYVGQKIVCLKDGHFHKKEKIYTCSGNLFCGSCKVWHVLTAETVFKPASQYDCNCNKEIGLTVYFGGDAKYFRPVQENFQSIKLIKILEKETELISEN